MIQPVNKYILVEPLEYKDFLQTEGGKYQEIGVIVDWDDSIPLELQKGAKVYFDSWLPKKYKKPNTHDEWYWLINYEDICAYDNEEVSPEQSVQE